MCALSVARSLTLDRSTAAQIMSGGGSDLRRAALVGPTIYGIQTIRRGCENLRDILGTPRPSRSETGCVKIRDNPRPATRPFHATFPNDN